MRRWGFGLPGSFIVSRRPEKRGPFQLVPVIVFAMVDRLS
jgi:hypothetical protein